MLFYILSRLGSIWNYLPRLGMLFDLLSWSCLGSICRGLACFTISYHALAVSTEAWPAFRSLITPLQYLPRLGMLFCILSVIMRSAEAWHAFRYLITTCQLAHTQLGSICRGLACYGSFCRGLACFSISYHAFAVSAKAWHAILYRQAVLRSSPPRSPRPESLAAARLTPMAPGLSFACRSPARESPPHWLSDSPPLLRQYRSLRHSSDLEHPDRHIMFTHTWIHQWIHILSIHIY